MVIDEISFANLNSFEEVEYSKIKNILKSKDSKFYIADTFKNTKYYVCGKYNLEDKTALIVIIDSPSIKSIACYLMIYSKEFELLNFTLIANKLIADKNEQFSSCIININNLIICSKEGVEYYEYSDIDLSIPFVINNCLEIAECANYIPKYTAIPKRNLNEYNFNNIFFESDSYFIPLKYCSPLNYSQITVDVGGYAPVALKNYFIDSKKISNGKTIVFFLNIYTFENLKVLKEIGYQIFRSDGKLEKTKDIAYYQIDNKGIMTFCDSKVLIYDDNISIESKCNYKDQITKKVKID